MCEKYKVEIMEMPLIWGVKIDTIRGKGPRKYIDIGEKLGPWLVMKHAQRQLNLNHAPSSKTKIREGYRFWNEGSQTIKFLIPNVAEIKSNNLLIGTQIKNNKQRYTTETMKANLEICGFNVLQVGEYNGNRTKFGVKCCRIDCENISEKEYKHFISIEQIPLCADCISLKNSHQVNGRKLFETSLFDIRPELLPLYKPELNDNLPPEKISKGSNKKVILCCEEHNHAYEIPINSLSTKIATGSWSSSGKCVVCNSLAFKFPDIAADWNFDKNIGTPEDYSYGNLYEAHWKCKNCGYEYQCSIGSRTGMNIGCHKCLNWGDSKIAQLMRQVIKDTRTVHKINKETKVADTLFRNDTIIRGSSGQEIVFELQGSYWHYGNDYVIKANEETGEQYHKDNLKFAQNRMNDQFVILLNEHDFGNGGVVPPYDCMKRAIFHAINFLKMRNFAPNSDVEYNKLKNDYAMKTGKAYYASLWNSKISEKMNEDLNKSMLEFVKNQAKWEVF